MKITSIEIHSKNSYDPIVLSFRDAKSLLPYIVQSITGLDATTLDSRVIVVKCGLNPEWRNYGDLRDTLYKAINSSRTGLVQLIFKNGSTIIAGIYGYISKVESPHTDKNPSITVTIQCNDPVIRGLERVTFTNRLASDVIDIVDDMSTAPHGFTFDLYLISSQPSLKLSSPVDASWSLIVTPHGGFLSGDDIFFSSEASNKYIYMTRAGATIQLGDAVAPTSSWPQMYPGHNHFKFSGVLGTVFRLQSVKWYPSYWGI